MELVNGDDTLQTYIYNTSEGHPIINISLKYYTLDILNAGNPARKALRAN